MQFERLFRFVSLVSVLFIFSIDVISADVNDDVSPLNSIIENLRLINQTSTLHSLLSSLNVAGSSVDLLKKCDPRQPITLFAPTNDALQSFVSNKLKGVGLNDLVNSSRKQELIDLFSYHMLNGRYHSRNFNVMNIMDSLLKLGGAHNNLFQKLDIVHQIPGIYNTFELSLLTNTSSPYSSAQGIIVFGNKSIGDQQSTGHVIRQNIPTKCGFIHLIDRVLVTPPSLEDALERAGLNRLNDLIDEYDIDDEVNNMNNVTFFGVINNAFSENWNKSLSNYSSIITNLIHNKLKQRKHSQEPHHQGLGIKRNDDDSDNGNDNDDTNDDNDDKNYLEKEKMLLFISSLTVPGIMSTEDLISRSPSNFTTLNGSLITTSFHDNKLWLSNRSHVLYGNLPFQGGLLHIISDFLYDSSTTSLEGQKPIITQPIQKPSQTQTESVCLDNLGLLNVQTSFSNFSSNNTNVNKTINVNGLSLLIPDSLPQCPPTDQLCYVAKLGSSCSSYYGNNTSNNNDNKLEVEIRPQCFNPDSHVCINNVTLCPKTHPHSCGEHCFSSSDYVCVTSFSLCPTSHPLSCGSACYNPNQYSCLNNQLIQLNQIPLPK